MRQLQNENRGMTTAGKSDVLEAVVQIIILKVLHDGGTMEGQSIARELWRKANGLIVIKEASVYIALSKLELSGWVKNQRSAALPRSGKYVLSGSARKFLPREMKEWQDFVEQWPQISLILDDVTTM
ncbi:MAG TPA: PadR family transcriptional regulator [Acidobacteriaceae bacterium]